MTALRAAYGDERPDSVESMLDTLLDMAIEIGGYTPFEVHDAMCDLGGGRARRCRELGSMHPDICQLVESWDDLSYKDLSHPALCVYPERCDDDGEISWAVAFKSRWVAEYIAGLLRDTEAHRWISSFSRIPKAAYMADQLFEPLAHRALAQTVDKKPWVLLPMKKSSNTDPDEPTFEVDVERRTAPLTFPKVKRKRLDFPKLPRSLEHRSYYVPIAPPFPLIDSFTVDIDEKSRSGTLWLFRFTTGTAQTGSAKDYVKIRQLVSTLRDQLASLEPPKKRSRVDEAQRERSPFVTVRYVLVSPVNNSNICTWKMPPGWSSDTSPTDDQGDVYLLEIPL